MSWTDLFRSRYVRSLESELATIRSKHAEETERIKTVHAQELERAINEANRGWAEADRLRQYLIPGLATSTRQTETSEKETPKEKLEEVSGTPFQRLAARIMKEDDERYRIAEEKRKAREGFPTVKKPEPIIPEQGQEN